VTPTDPALVLVLAVLGLIVLLVTAVIEAHPDAEAWAESIVNRILR